MSDLMRRFLIFLGPMMVTNVVQSLSGTINNVFLGQMIGVQALAAATAFFPILLVLLSLVMGMGAGTSVLVGRATGAGDTDRVVLIAGTSLAATLLLGLAISVPGLLAAGWMMRALRTPPQILHAATLYGRIIFAATPLLFAYFLPQSMLRGVGDTRTPLRMVLVSTGVGVVASPLLIEVGLGIAGPAVALIASMLVSLLWVGRYLRRTGNPLAPTAALARRLRIDRGVFLEILHLGLPASTQMITMSVAELVLLGLINHFGSNATAAYGAVNLLMSYMQFPAFSISITASVLAAQAIGAGQGAILGAVTRTALTLNLAITGTLVALAYLLATPLLRLFITDAGVVALAAHLLRVVAWSNVLFGAAGIFSGVMRASGTVLMPMTLQVGTILLVEIPLATWLSRARGLDGIWFAYAATFCIMFVLQGAYYTMVWSARRASARNDPLPA